MYINLHLPLFNFAYAFFLFFLSIPLNIFVSFIFFAFFPNWHLALVLFSSLCFCALVTFVLVDIIFGFLCLSGQSIVLYFCWTVLILLMSVYVYVYIQSHFFIVVLNLCIYIGLLQFCGVFLFFFFFFFLSFFCFFFFSFLFFIFLTFNYFKPIIFFLHLFLCLPSLLFFSPCS